jgi:hypothetical protein
VSSSSSSKFLLRRQAFGGAPAKKLFDGTQDTILARVNVCVKVNVAVFNSGLLNVPVVLANKLNKNRAFCLSWKEGRGR